MTYEAAIECNHCRSAFDVIVIGDGEDAAICPRCGAGVRFFVTSCDVELMVNVPERRRLATFDLSDG